LTPEQRLHETQILHMNMVDYWFEVDINGGEGVSAHFIPDGIFHVGGEPLVGHAAIEQFYAWRRGRGERTSRHVITNFRADFAHADHATTHCIMMLLAADGAPIHPSAPPIVTADLVDHCIRGDDGRWLVTERIFTPLFMGGEAPTTPPEQIARDHNA
jgi:hypothetical protein